MADDVSGAVDVWEDGSPGNMEDGDEAPYPFEDSDCEVEQMRARGKGNTLAPDQLDKARWRDVCTIAKVCDIDEPTAHELLVREGWDHQKVVEMHCPFQGLPSQPAPNATCPVCQESCAVGSSDGVRFFELCNHPIHKDCAKMFVINEIEQMAGMSQERFNGSVTCPWCIAHKEKTPGFLSEDMVATLMSSKYYETYKQVRRNTLARNERHCTKEGCTNVVRFSSVKLGPNVCLTLECGCGHRFCLLCGSDEHWPASCEDITCWLRMEAGIEEHTRELQNDIATTRWELREIRTELANINVRRPDAPRAEAAGGDRQAPAPRQEGAGGAEQMEGPPANDDQPQPQTQPQPLALAPPPHALVPDPGAHREGLDFALDFYRHRINRRRSRRIEHGQVKRRSTDVPTPATKTSAGEADVGNGKDPVSPDAEEKKGLDPVEASTPVEGREKPRADVKRAGIMGSLRHRIMRAAAASDLLRVKGPVGYLLNCSFNEELQGDETQQNNSGGADVEMASDIDARDANMGKEPQEDPADPETPKDKMMASGWTLGGGLFGNPARGKSNEARKEATRDGPSILGGWRRKARTPGMRHGGNGNRTVDRQSVDPGTLDAIRVVGKRSFRTPGTSRATSPNSKAKKLLRNERNTDGKQTPMGELFSGSDDEQGEPTRAQRVASEPEIPIWGTLCRDIAARGAKSGGCASNCGGSVRNVMERPSKRFGNIQRTASLPREATVLELQRKTAGDRLGLTVMPSPCSERRGGKSRGSGATMNDAKPAMGEEEEEEEEGVVVQQIPIESDATTTTGCGPSTMDGDTMNSGEGLSLECPELLDISNGSEREIDGRSDSMGAEGTEMGPSPTDASPFCNQIVLHLDPGNAEGEDAGEGKDELGPEVLGLAGGVARQPESISEDCMHERGRLQGLNLGGQQMDARKNNVPPANNATKDEQGNRPGELDAGGPAASPESNSNTGDSTTTVQDVGSNESGEEQHYIARYIKDCPRCFCLCEKMWGCDHVTCPRCRHHFCWKCRADWSSSGGYQHLEHCPGEGTAMPTRDDAEKQYQSFLYRHGEKSKYTDKENFINEWLQREREMRTQFEYHVDPPPRWQAEFGAYLRERREAVIERMARLREREGQLEQRLQGQQRDLEWRRKFHVSRTLQKEAVGGAGSSSSSGDEEVMRASMDEDYARYEAVVEQGRKIGKALGVLEELKKREMELQSECYIQLNKVLLSCERTIWSYRLDRFFNSALPVNHMVEYNIGELENASELYTIFAQVLHVSTENGSDESGDAAALPKFEDVNVGALASSSEYYARKRNNFIEAWEEMIIQRRGECQNTSCLIAHCQELEIDSSTRSAAK
ncbi:hypothetical protein BSKO_03676 [Bryopsis sp. KO-2023]|nr:hypothetical protein BSKO_03676 [Bryopsis sp. KO-2023]